MSKWRYKLADFLRGIADRVEGKNNLTYGKFETAMHIIERDYLPKDKIFIQGKNQIGVIDLKNGRVRGENA